MFRKDWPWMEGVLRITLGVVLIMPALAMVLAGFFGSLFLIGDIEMKLEEAQSAGIVSWLEQAVVLFGGLWFMLLVTAILGSILLWIDRDLLGWKPRKQEPKTKRVVSNHPPL